MSQIGRVGASHHFYRLDEIHHRNGGILPSCNFVCVLLLIFFSSTLPAQTVKQLFNVTTVQVKELNSSQSSVNYGFVVADDSLVVDVTPRYSGFVERLSADTLYKYVKKGEVLAELYSPEVLQAKEDYLNSLNYPAHSNSGMVQSTRTKLQLLGVSLHEIRDIEKQRKVSQTSTLVAPISGWVFEKNINKGSAFGNKKRLFQLVNLERVWIEIKIYPDELASLHTKTRFIATAKSINKTFIAKKELLYPSINPKEATATLRLSVDNPDTLLKPGMYMSLQATSASTQKLVIPRTATIRKYGQWYVFLATDIRGEYEPVAIKLKALDREYYEVISGLTLKDRVVNNALFMMDSDAQISRTYP
jgi:Cu(I)/Ag(I) efflux system membrane fusion protein